MPYVLRKTDAPRRGQYVAPAGSERAYTPRLERARRFATKEAAEHDACGNEAVIRLEDAR